MLANSEYLKIKIYGERNTGTNYLSKLLLCNLKAELLPGTFPQEGVVFSRFKDSEYFKDIYFRICFQRNLGWKHAMVDVQKLLSIGDRLSDVIFLTLSKNPYSFLLSLYRRPYHQRGERPEDFEGFLKAPWKTVGRESAPREFANPIQMWNMKNMQYLSLGKAFPTLNLTYEDMLKTPGQIVAEISKRFEIKTSGEDFVNYAESTKDSSKDFDFYRHYYLEEQWRKKLDAATVELINEHLDDEVMEHFAYQKIDPFDIVS